jgi:hypothetical protein
MKQFAKLRDYSTKLPGNLKAILDNVAAQVPQRPLTGTMAIVVFECERRRLLHANLSSAEIEEIPEGKTPDKSPDFAIYVEHDALMKILRGQLSPLEAVSEGQLRYGGDEELGVAIFRELASTDDAVFEPCRQP